MGTASVQGHLWGARSRDYAAIAEPFFCPVYETVLDQAGVEAGTRYLDVGCGPGLAVQFAARRGAQVSGLDAAEPSLAIARTRTPAGDFRSGEMEELPWPAASFDVVTGFNAFQFAAHPANALGEAKRVTKAGGRVAMVVWGRDEDCETTATLAAIRRVVTSNPPENAGPPALRGAEQMEMLLEQARLALLARGEVDCPFTFSDLETALRGLMSTGPAVAAVQQVGAGVVQRAITESLAPYRTGDGGYRQHNRFYYAIAAAEL